MISECLDRKKSFGVVRAKEEGVAEIGCTAEIITVAKKYPDGRMDIVTEGRERFEVMQVNQERSFLQAEVLYLQRRTGRGIGGRHRASGEITIRNRATRGLRCRRLVRSLKTRRFPFIWWDRFRLIRFQTNCAGNEIGRRANTGGHFLLRNHSAEPEASGAGAPKGWWKRPRSLTSLLLTRQAANRAESAGSSHAKLEHHATACATSRRRIIRLRNWFYLGGFHHEFAAHTRRIAPESF